MTGHCSQCKDEKKRETNYQNHTFRPSDSSGKLKTGETKILGGENLSEQIITSCFFVFFSPSPGTFAYSGFFRGSREPFLEERETVQYVAAVGDQRHKLGIGGPSNEGHFPQETFVKFSSCMHERCPGLKAYKKQSEIYNV